jgi:hypothetical protein
MNCFRYYQDNGEDRKVELGNTMLETWDLAMGGKLKDVRSDEELRNVQKAWVRNCHLLRF